MTTRGFVSTNKKMSSISNNKDDVEEVVVVLQDDSSSSPSKDDSSSPLSLLLSLGQDPKTTISNALTTRQTRQRQEYEERLLTFQAVTYWAKPACLSPIVCARFGWSNADRDMLVCSCCGAALAILYHPNLSTKAATSITNSYRQQLATSHTSECSFRLEAEKYLIQLRESGEGPVESSSSRLVTIPTAFSSVFPPESVELMEHPFPRSLLQRNVDQLEQALRRAVTKHPVLLQEDDPQQGESPWKYPEPELSTELDRFQPPQPEALGVETRGGQETWNMIAEASKIIGTGNNMTTALALLGWTPVSAAEDEAANAAESSKQALPEHGGSRLPPVVSVGCPVCLAWMDISLITDAPEPAIIIEDDAGQEARSTMLDRKRRRTRSKYPNPLEGHRHYCPWVCGFPNQYSSTEVDEMPVWKTVATRLFQEKTARYPNSSIPDSKDFETLVDNEGDRTFERVRQILQLGIVSTVKTAVDLAH